MAQPTWIRPGLRKSWPWAERVFCIEYQIAFHFIWPIFGEPGYRVWQKTVGRLWLFEWARRIFRQVWLCYLEALPTSMRHRIRGFVPHEPEPQQQGDSQ